MVTIHIAITTVGNKTGMAVIPSSKDVTDEEANIAMALKSAIEVVSEWISQDDRGVFTVPDGGVKRMVKEIIVQNSK